MIESSVRNVAYFRCWSDHTWDTDFVQVPADTPEEQLEDAVQAAIQQRDWPNEAPLFCGCYFSDKEVQTAAPALAGGGQPEGPRLTLPYSTIREVQREDLEEFLEKLFGPLDANGPSEAKNGALASVVCAATGARLERPKQWAAWKKGKREPWRLYELLQDLVNQGLIPGGAYLITATQ